LLKLVKSGGGLFETVAGLRASRLAMNQEAVDVTSLESAGRWRELLPDAGVRSADISGSGVFRDEASDERVRAIFFGGEVPDCQVVVPDFGIIEGRFQIAALEYSGTHNGEATFEMSLRSAGELTFTVV
jgi:TP901-1 family phage major tail protein